MGSIPGRGTKIPHATWHGRKKKNLIIYRYVLYIRSLWPMVKATSSPSRSRGEAGFRSPFLTSLAFSRSPAQRKNDPGPVLRRVLGPDYCPGHIGLPVVTTSTQAFVRDTVPDSHYSLCPFLSSCANKMTYQQELGTGCQVLGRGRRHGNCFMK